MIILIILSWIISAIIIAGFIIYSHPDDYDWHDIEDCFFVITICLFIWWVFPIAAIAYIISKSSTFIMEFLKSRQNKK